MLVKFINHTLGLALFLFIATAPVISRQPAIANDTFTHVARQLGIDASTTEPIDEAATINSATEGEEYTDGCLIEEAVYETF